MCWTTELNWNKRNSTELNWNRDIKENETEIEKFKRIKLKWEEFKIIDKVEDSYVDKTYNLGVF